jgi:hypothetical protein
MASAVSSGTASPATRSRVGEVSAFCTLALDTLNSPNNQNSPNNANTPKHSTRSAARCKTPSTIKRLGVHKTAHKTPDTGHSVKRTKHIPVQARGVLEPRVLEFEASTATPTPPAPGPPQEVFDACDVVPLIPGMREAYFYRAEFTMPEPFGSVLSILPFCDTTAD